MQSLHVQCIRCPYLAQREGQLDIFKALLAIVEILRSRKAAPQSYASKMLVLCFSRCVPGITLCDPAAKTE